MNAQDFEELGLYEPGSPHAEERLGLLHYLVGLGASADDLVEYRDQLGGLASVVALRGGPGLTLPEVAARSSLDEAKILEFNRAAGFPTPGPHDRVFAQGWAELGSGLAAGEQLFGHDVVLQLVRVMGAATARMADAMVSAFLVNVEPSARREDPVGLGIARANAEAISILPAVTRALDLLLRQHILTARRTILGDNADAGYQMQQLCVGFVDLVGSTSMTETTEIGELGSLLTEFEHIAADAVVESGGRLVKLIGDGVMYTANDPRAGCDIAVQLIRKLRDHPKLPQARGGLAWGHVMLRDGDVFGPVVNLAARIVAKAGPSQVVLTVSMATTLEVRFTSLGAYELKGFESQVELATVEID